jgi:V-type H+-transporting ATPase proteolipid subunit
MANPLEFCDIDSGKYTLMDYQTFDTSVEGSMCNPAAVLFGTIGASMSMALSAVGTAYGTAKACEGIAKTCEMYPRFLMQAMLPVVMGGVGAIYGLVVAVMIGNGITAGKYTLWKGFIDLAAGLAVGVSGIGSGYAIGVSGDTGVRMAGENPRTFVGMILVMVFAGVPSLYGLIVALTMSASSDTGCHTVCYNPCCDKGACATWDGTAMACPQ